jgi:sugar lactone lactonase YvrE
MGRTAVVAAALAAVLAGGAAARAQDRTIWTRTGGLVDGPPAVALVSDVLESLYVYPSGAILFTDMGHEAIRLYDPAAQTLRTIAGDGQKGFRGDGGPVAGARFSFPWWVTVDRRGVIYVSDFGNNRVRAINPNARPERVCGVLIAPGCIDTIAGSGAYTSYDANGNPIDLGDGGPALEATFIAPRGLEVGPEGNVYICDIDNQCVRVVYGSGPREGTIDTFAGTHQNVSDPHPGGKAAETAMNSPSTVARDSAGNFYISSGGFHILDAQGDYTPVGVVWKVDPRGNASLYAGDGIDQSGGDGGPATAAGLNADLFGFAAVLDSAGNLFITDNLGIRRVDAVTKIITTVAGDPLNNFPGFFYSSTEDGIAPLAAHFGPPLGPFVRDGSLYFLDGNTGTLRRLDPGAGGGGPTLHDVGPFRAGLKGPDSVAIDAFGDAFVGGDAFHGRIHKVDARGGVTTVVNVADVHGTAGEGGLATAAEGGWFTGCAFDEAGDLFLCDFQFQRILRVNAVRGAGGARIGPTSTIERVASVPFFPIQIVVFRGKAFVTDGFAQVWEVDVATGAASPIAGNGTPGYSGDGGLALRAELNAPDGLALDGANGILYVADTSNGVVRSVDLVAGTIAPVFALPGAPGPGPNGHLALLGSDLLFVAHDGLGQIFAVDLAAALPSAVLFAGAGSPFPTGTRGDEVAAPEAELNLVEGIAVDPSGKLVMAEHASQALRVLGHCDIRPGRLPNLVYPTSPRAIAVAIESSAKLDAPAEIDPATIRVAGAAPVLVSVCDVNGDGRADLVVYVRQSDMALAPGARQAAIEATTRDGRPFRDADWVTVVAGPDPDDGNR